MREIGFTIMRSLAFARKEIAEIARQPRLVATLILGPFLILGLFGVGYQRQSRPLRTTFVSSSSGEFMDEIQTRVDDFGDAITFDGVVTDPDTAVAKLRSGETDIVVIVPDRPVETIRQGNRAVFRVLHDQLDPFEVATIDLIATTTIDAVNRAVLAEVVASGQVESQGLENVLPLAAEAATAMREALEAGDTEGARRQRRQLATTLRQVEAQTGSTEVLIARLRNDFERQLEAEGVAGPVGDLTSRVESFGSGDGSIDEQAEEARSIETEVHDLEGTLADFQRVEPEILVSPFGAEAAGVQAVTVDIADYYAPGVIALLLQHLAITFAALSLVREEQLGTTEVFRVAPVRAGEILAGKYVGYLVSSSLVGAALTALSLFVFGVPLVGSGVAYAGVLVLLIVASLGIGFVISLLVGTDTQAVNVAMIALLLSLFFSGFFLSLDRLAPLVRGVSWALPITHALDSLRDVMFRGARVDARTWIALGAASVGTFGVAWLLLRRRLSAS